MNDVQPTGPLDERVQAMARGERVRIIAVRCDAVARRLGEAHDPGPTGAVALSRVATAALLLGGTLKDRQQVGVQLNGDGPLGELYAVADADGRVRATVAEPRADVPLGPLGIDLPAGIGQGRLTIIKRMAEEEPAYQGVIPLVASNVAEDLADYFTRSEQLPSAVALGETLDSTGISAAGGLLVQMMPGHDEADVEAVEAAMRALPPLSWFFDQGGTATELAQRVAADATILLHTPVRFQCNCERERYARVLVSMGVQELTRMREELDVVECICHFCNTVYRFTQEEMGALIFGARRFEEKLRQLQATEN